MKMAKNEITKSLKKGGKMKKKNHRKKEQK